MPPGAIAAIMVQWTGAAHQGDPVGFAIALPPSSSPPKIEDAPWRLFGSGTSISGAIYGLTLFFAAPYRAIRRLFDVSDDGVNNRGRPVTEACDEAVRAGVTINGLPILALEPDLDRYYFDNVIGGPGAFMVPAASYQAFAEAIVKKLIGEIAANNR